VQNESCDLCKIQFGQVILSREEIELFTKHKNLMIMKCASMLETKELTVEAHFGERYGYE